MIKNKTPALFAPLFALFLALALAAPTAVRAEGALYEPAPPPGSAFLRVINASGQGAVDVQLDGKPFVQAGDAAASDYVVTPQGRKTAAWKGQTLPLTLTAGKFYSLVVAAEPRLIEDPAMQSRAKALVRLYNLSSKPSLSLKTADGKLAVIEGVPAQSAADRMVNAAKLAFGVFDGDSKLASTSDVVIERGFAYSVLAIGKGDALKAVWVKSATRAK